MNLIPFDLEAAKKDPSRVRLFDRPDMLPIAGEACLGGWCVLWEGANTPMYFPAISLAQLRLTAPEPKRVKVAKFVTRQGKEHWFESAWPIDFAWQQVSDWHEIEIREVMG